VRDVARTVADEVFARVQELTTSGSVATRAQAIREVAAEMERSVPATSSAYYAGARRARESGQATPDTATRSSRAGRASGHSDAPTLYAEMLPLVEAGATIEQAARRFGDEDSVPEIAAGFARWRARQGAATSRGVAEAEEADGHEGPGGDGMEQSLSEARERLAVLEGENRSLRRDLTRARQAMARARVILEAAAD
jgi:hypothetical protein